MRPNFLLLPLPLLLLLGTCVLAQSYPPATPQRGGLLYGNDRKFAAAPGKALNADLAPFFHGVASGDPLADRVVLWTRVTPQELDGAPVTVQWRVATDTALTEVVTTGEMTTGPARDYTVKVDVDGLAPGTTYYYGFTALGANSLTGKTKTTPVATDHLRFGVVSCANYQAGYFNAYGLLAARTDLDAIVHLGDYIYEYGNFFYGSDSVWNDRPLEPAGEVLDLFDYRARYSTYRLDTHLIRAHQQHPIVAVWDDHEFANDSWTGGASNHTPATEGPWADRVSAARRAYYEWLPVREPADGVLYRSLRYGDLAELLLLDTRIEARDEQLDDVTDPALADPDRTLLGPTQRAWLLDRLRQSTARWKLIGQQVVFSEFNAGWTTLLLGGQYEEAESLFLDIWDGYPAERAAIMDALRQDDIGNVVILTGDFHSGLAFEVAAPAIDLRFDTLEGLGRLPFFDPSPAYDPATGRGAVAVEFVTPSVTSANFDENGGAELGRRFGELINSDISTEDLTFGNPNPHLKYADLVRHGYYLLDVRPDTVQADYYFTDILNPVAEEDFGAGLASRRDTNQLLRVAGPAAPKAVQDVPAPARPPGRTNRLAPVPDLRVLSVYPNPAVGSVRVQYALNRAGEVALQLTDATGRAVGTPRRERQGAGLYTYRLDVADLPPGPYFLRLRTAAGTVVQRLVKAR